MRRVPFARTSTAPLTQRRPPFEDSATKLSFPCEALAERSIASSKAVHSIFCCCFVTLVQPVVQHLVFDHTFSKRVMPWVS